MSRVDGSPNPPDGHLDAIGGQPLAPAAAEAMRVANGTGWADPTALHHAGRNAGALLDAARASLAHSLSVLQAPGVTPVSPSQVWLTSSPARAQAIALAATRGPVTIGAVEAAHLLDLAQLRPGTTVVGVDGEGRVDPGPFLGADVRVLQAANPEVGTRQPVAAIGPGTLLMDAPQLIGRDLIPDGWTSLIAAASDWGGPAGVTVLATRGVSAPAPAIRGWLDGSRDIVGAVGAAMALESVLPTWSAQARADRARIDAIRAAAAAISDVEVLGSPDDRLPHIVTFSVLYVSGEEIVTALDAQGFAVASGSACVAEEARPSHVLAAMGAYTGGNVRVSLPFGCTDETVERFIAVLAPTIARVRDDVLGAR